MAPTRIAANSVSFVDLNDGILKGPEPTNKTAGLLWLDETDPANPRLKSWNGSAWVDQAIDLSYLDPGAADDIEDSKQKLADMADDSIVTQAERIQILNDLISITGKVDISDLTTTLPTAADIDTSIKKGDFYYARQNAISAGLSAVHIDIDALEDAYLALCSYLNGLNPKPWNVWVETNLIIAAPSTWKQRWLDYNNATAKLAQTVTDKIKDDADVLAQRVTSTEGDISNLGDAIALKVSTLTYEEGMTGVSNTINENIGKDKWLAKQYLMASSEGNQANYLPTYQSIAGKQPSFMTFVSDATTFRDTFGADEYYIGHFMTALYAKVAKSITFTITHNDGCVIYLNGGIGYSKNTSITTAASVTLSLMQGWNSIEILYAEQTGTSSGFTLSAALKSLVDNLSCYGLGDAIGGRMAYAESSIKVNADSIVSKVEKTDFTGEKVVSMINQTADTVKISAKNIHLVVGGRNLVVRTNELIDQWIDTTGAVTASSDETSVMENYISVVPNETLTFSKNESVGFWRYSYHDASQVYVNRIANNASEFQWVVPADVFFIRVSYPTGAEVKIERGNIATGWVAAPEDVSQQIVDSANAVTEAYTSAISATEDSINFSVSKTLFGDAEDPNDTGGLKGEMAKYTDTQVTATAGTFNLRFGTIEDTQEGHGTQLSEVYSYFKFDPAGLNIGKSDSPLQMNLSNSQMSFIDNGNIVAYVNGQKMYIDTAEILNSIIVGNHKIEKYNDNITLVKWVGV